MLFPFWTTASKCRSDASSFLFSFSELGHDWYVFFSLIEFYINFCGVLITEPLKFLSSAVSGTAELEEQFRHPSDKVQSCEYLCTLH